MTRLLHVVCSANMLCRKRTRNSTQTSSRSQSISVSHAIAHATAHAHTHARTHAEKRANADKHARAEAHACKQAGRQANMQVRTLTRAFVHSVAEPLESLHPSMVLNVKQSLVVVGCIKCTIRKQSPVLNLSGSRPGLLDGSESPKLAPRRALVFFVFWRFLSGLLQFC